MFDIFPDGSGRSGLLILSILISQISFMILPAAITKEAAIAARNTFIPGASLGTQINAATITEMKVIRKLIGRISFIIAVSFSVNAEKVLINDSPKLTKRLNIWWGVLINLSVSKCS